MGYVIIFVYQDIHFITFRRVKMAKKKDDTILIRINGEDKKQLKIRAIEKGMSVSDYILYCVLREIAEHEINNIK